MTASPQSTKTERSGSESAKPASQDGATTTEWLDEIRHIEDQITAETARILRDRRILAPLNHLGTWTRATPYDAERTLIPMIPSEDVEVVRAYLRILTTPDGTPMGGSGDHG